MYRHIKKIVLHLAKALGLFHLARYLTRNGLRILCYHAFALEDESAFRARMYLRSETFEKRLRFLKESGFPVLQLGQALDLLDKGRLPTAATVLTIDDGFFSVYKLGLRPLRQHSLPATVYVSTYYADRDSPVFRLCVQYMFWKSRAATIDSEGLGLPRTGTIDLGNAAEKERFIWDVISHGELHCDEPSRVALERVLGDRLAVDYEDISRSRMFHIMTAAQMRECLAAGIDIQLHTHRHRFPEDEPQALREISDNRKILEPLAGLPLTHFCYPSGIFSESQFPWLRSAGIRSATTCESGINYASTEKLALLRFLDGEDISQIEFAAEVYGFTELLRKLRLRFRSVFGTGKKRAHAHSYF